MKKWNEPELWMLGVENTSEEEWETYDPKTHDGFCHKLNSDCNGKVNDHSADGHKGHTWSGNPCLKHGIDNNGQPACCCLS